MTDQTFQVNCGFFDSIDNDRLYSANEMNKPYKRVITNGVFATPSGTASTDLQVLSNDGMNIVVSPGEALFGDKWFENPADIPITVPSNNSIVPRIDSVIAQIDNTQSGRVGNIVYRTGTASSSPVAPSLSTSDTIIEYRLANVYVGAAAVSISQANITDMRGSNDCPWVTSLIKQVDTSTLFNQWQSAYENYYNESTEDFNDYTETRKEEFDQFLDNLTEDLTVATNVIMLTNNYISTGTVSNIPIGIPSYDPTTDVLMVFVNGLRVTEGYNYTINANNTSIDLKVALTTGQTVNFLVLKSVIAADIQTTITMIQQLNTKIAAIESDYNTLSTSMYIATGTNDNIALSNMVQTFLNGGNDYQQLEINVYGNLSCTTPAATVNGTKYWFNFWSSGATRRVKINFANANRITVDNTNIDSSVFISAADTEILNLQAVMSNCTNGTMIENNSICTNCAFWLNEKTSGTGNLVGAYQGIFTNCRMSVTASSGKAYGFSSNGNTLNLNNCEVYAYNGSGASNESVAVQVQGSQTSNVLIMNACNCPIVARTGYKQDNTVKINSGYYSLVSNVLGQAALKYSTGDGKTETGTMVISS